MRPGGYRLTVQRLFSFFPDRWPGLALLVLRNALAAMLLSVNLRLFAEAMPHAIVGCIAAALLCVGVLTPPISVIAGSLWLVDLHLVPASMVPFHVFCATIGAVLAVLGPGAYSVDSRLFGRRVLVLPSGKSTDT